MTERMTAAGRTVARLSDPSLRWMAALYDPRTCAEEPCVPHGVNLSQKMKVFARGSLSTGTTGFGFIALAPFLMAASNMSPVTTSVSGSLMSATTALSSVASVANANSNSQFVAGNFGTGVGTLQYKLVGCAIYVRYAGTELNRGGDMVLVEEPNHNTLFNYTYTTAMGLDYAKRVSVSNEWSRVCYTPNSDTECFPQIWALPHIPTPFWG